MVIKFLYSPAPPPPTVWALDLPTIHLKFFGPRMALAYRLDAISQGPKKSRIPGPNPLPLPPSNGYALGCSDFYFFSHFEV
jgi:hypothetical protein